MLRVCTVFPWHAEWVERPVWALGVDTRCDGALLLMAFGVCFFRASPSEEARH